MIDTEAWWITTDGQILRINGLHSTYVFRYPEKFGFTYNEIKRIKGRDEDSITDEAVMKGAMHIRYISGPYTLIFVEYNGDKTTNFSTKMFKFLTETLPKFHVQDNTKLQLYDYNANASKVTTVGKEIHNLEQEMAFEDKEYTDGDVVMEAIDTIESGAWWITPDGQVLEINGPRSESVIRYPDKFGFTRNEIKKIKGRDDESITEDAVAKGAILIGYSRQYNSVAVDYDSDSIINFNTKLFKFLTELLSKFHVKDNTKLQLYDYNVNASNVTTVGKGIRDLEQGRQFEVEKYCDDDSVEEYEEQDQIAWWITLDGQVLEVHDELHSESVIRYPEKFGFTLDEIKKIKGLRADSITEEAIMKGAMHIRYIPGPYNVIFVDYNGYKTTNFSTKLFNFLTETLPKFHVKDNTRLQLFDYSINAFKDTTVGKEIQNLGQEMEFENKEYTDGDKLEEYDLRWININSIVWIITNNGKILRELNGFHVNLLVKYSQDLGLGDIRKYAKDQNKLAELKEQVFSNGAIFIRYHREQNFMDVRYVSHRVQNLNEKLLNFFTTELPKYGIPKSTSLNIREYHGTSPVPRDINSTVGEVIKELESAPVFEDKKNNKNRRK